MSTPAKVINHHVWNAKKTAIVLTPGFAFIAAAFRLLIISNYQTTTAVAIAATSGAVSTLIGTLVPLVQFFLPASMWVLLGVVFFYRGDDRQMRKRSAFLALLALGGSLIVTPTKASWDDILSEVSRLPTYLPDGWLTAVIVLASVILVIGIIAAVVAREPGHLGVSALITVAVSIGEGLLLLALGIFVVFNFVYPFAPPIESIPSRARAMWLPAETVSFKSPGGTVVGYVLAAGDKWTSILRDSDRTILVVHTDEVQTRQVCRIGQPNDLPLFPLPGAEIPMIPECTSSFLLPPPMLLPKSP